MRKIFGLIILAFMIIPYSNTFGETYDGSMITNISTENGVFQVEEEINISKIRDITSLDRVIECYGVEKIKVNKIMITDDMGEWELKPLSFDSLSGNSYMTFDKNFSDGSHTMTIKLKLTSPLNVKKVKINYEYENFSSYGNRGDYSYVKKSILSRFGGVNFSSSIVNIKGEVVGLWSNNSNISIELKDGITTIAMVNPSTYGNIIIKWDKNMELFKKTSSTGFDKILLDLDNKSNNLIIGEDETLIPNEVYIDRYKIVFGVLSCIIVVGVCYITIKKRKKNVASVNMERRVFKEDLNKISYSYDRSKKKESFKMPKQIPPAYIGILLNTSVGDIIYTITLELIRRGVIEVVQAPEYKGIRESGVYRKFIFRLTEVPVNLKPFEEKYIELIRDIDDIKLLNLEEIPTLIKEGFFNTVIQEVSENFKAHLKAQVGKKLSFDEALKNKNMDSERWIKLKKRIKELSIEEVLSLKLEEIERLHVIITALGMRECEFSFFSFINPNALLMSNYFSSIEERFDNGEYVLNYLEEKFI